MANEQKQPDPLPPEQGVEHENTHGGQHVPPGATDAEPTGLPTTDRHKVETDPSNG